MERVVPRMGGKLFVDSSARGIVPLLPLDGLRSVVAPQAAGTPANAVAGGGR